MSTNIAYLTCGSSIKQGLRDHTIKAEPDDFPLFLYRGGVICEEDLFDGFLKGDLLIIVSPTMICF